MTRWVMTIALLAAALVISGFVAAVLRDGSDAGPREDSGAGPLVRLPPPRSLEELVSTADVVVTAQVTRHLGRRTLSADGKSYDEEPIELTVIEYLKGIGPPSLVVRQPVSPEDAQGLAYAFTVPAVGATGFFFLARDHATGDWTAYFGPAGRILEGPGGTAILDREQLPQPAFLAGKSMADVDRDLRRLLSER